MTETPRSFVDKVVATKGSLIHKLKAKDSTGQWAYYFLLVEPAKETAFLKSLEGQGIINLETYGKIIASCYGQEPSADVKEMLKGKYGFEI